MKRFLVFFIAALAKLAGLSQPVKPALIPAAKNDQTLLWQISGKGLKKTSYLFGTFHILCKKDIPIGSAVEKAIGQSNAVYMEMDMDDPKTMLGGLTFVLMKGGEKLRDFYTETEYNRLNQFFKDSLGIGLGLFQKMKPLTLEAFIYKKMMDCQNPGGVETELMAVAKKAKKEIYGFESIDFQGTVFDSIPYAVQARQLLEIVDSFADYRLRFGEMIHAYKKQKLDSIEAYMMSDDLNSKESYEALLYNRNRNWVTQLKELLPKKSLFVAVGAGHLPGKDGLIDLLRKEGYRVTPLLNKWP